MPLEDNHALCIFEDLARTCAFEEILIKTFPVAFLREGDDVSADFVILIFLVEVSVKEDPSFDSSVSLIVVVSLTDGVGIFINTLISLRAFVARVNRIIFIERQPIDWAEVNIVVTAIIIRNAGCKHDGSEANTIMIYQSFFEEVIQRWSVSTFGHSSDVVCKGQEDESIGTVSNSVETTGVVVDRLLHWGMQFRIVKEFGGIR